MPAALRSIDNLNLPHVWRAPELARVQEEVVSSGHASLDGQLPGGGWPMGNLVEILHERPGAHVWQLLLPALTSLAAKSEGPVVLVNPPYAPFGPSLSAQGLPVHRLLLVESARPTSSLWAAEQALRCRDVISVLAWLPGAKTADLRRLHLAAAQHGKLMFVFRGMKALNESSPARLRMHVQGAEKLQLQILKRRGPPLDLTIELPAHPARLAAMLQARQRHAAPCIHLPLPEDRSHVLDRHLALA